MKLCCDAPFCQEVARWMVGDYLQPDIARGHTSCDLHLPEACDVTLDQLAYERPGTDAITSVIRLVVE